MIVSVRNGRLGNQLFQYCAMRKLQPRGKIISVGMTEITSTIDGLEMHNLEFGKSAKIYRIIRRTLECIARSLRLISYVDEEVNETGSTFRVTNGLIRNIVYF